MRIDSQPSWPGTRNVLFGLIDKLLRSRLSIEYFLLSFLFPVFGCWWVQCATISLLRAYCRTDGTIKHEEHQKKKKTSKISQELDSHTLTINTCFYLFFLPVPFTTSTFSPSTTTHTSTI